MKNSRFLFDRLCADIALAQSRCHSVSPSPSILTASSAPEVCACLEERLLQHRPMLMIRPLPPSSSSLSIHPNESIQRVFPRSALDEAHNRFQSFVPTLRRLFPSASAALHPSFGVASPLVEWNVDGRAHHLGVEKVRGRLLAKLDSHLPVVGSVKARGGMFEVLSTALSTLERNGFPDIRHSSPEQLAEFMSSSLARSILSSHKLVVGSTGNLGMSIGIVGSALGFSVEVHMSSDAKKWKKDKLHAAGVTVVEYDSDYSTAVKRGRELAKLDPFSHFVDDEDSLLLFQGYSTAAFELAHQLEMEGVVVDNHHPLCVYVPCGVGGAPGGVCAGLKHIFGDAVHVFLAEPIESCCATLGLLQFYSSTCSSLVQRKTSRPVHHYSSDKFVSRDTIAKELLSVYDIGLSNQTIADGLAVARVADFVLDAVGPSISGAYTIPDDSLLKMVDLVKNEFNYHLEPSATAGLFGPLYLEASYSEFPFSSSSIKVPWDKVTHIPWTTGGSLVPDDEFSTFLSLARSSTAK